jgi:FkbM family methyltransferase
MTTIQLDERTMVVRLNFGGHLVVPTWNIDVGVGLIRDGVIEPWTSRAIQALLKPANTYINVGANLGYYMVLGAQCVNRQGRVIAVEANKLLLPYLMRSLYWSGYPDVIRLYNCAASDDDGAEIDIMFDPQFIGGASVAHRVSAPQITERLEDCLWENASLSDFVGENGLVMPATGHMVRGKCKTQRLDSIMGDKDVVDVLHMDIEGSEPACVLGAQGLLGRSPNAAIVMEWSPHYCLTDQLIAKTKSMCELFEANGYSYYRIKHETFRNEMPFPELGAIPDREALWKTPHNDILIAKNIGRYHPEWPKRVSTT